MDIWTASFLGLIQGLTEFLLVSSSGHLVLFQKIIPGFSQPGVLFDVTLHFGTLASVVYFFRKFLFSITTKYLYLLMVGTLPAVVLGFVFRENFEAMFSNPKLLGYEFLITGFLNFLVDSPVKLKSKLNVKNSFLIGIAQAFSIIPAISRSGATIFTGVKLGIDKKKCAEFSFLLSIPAILGANVLEISTHATKLQYDSTLEYLAGFIVAFVVGFATIGVVMKLLRERKFKFFGYYAVVLGLLVILSDKI